MPTSAARALATASISACASAEDHAEVLGGAGKTRREEWIAVFEEGVGRFRRRDFAGANGCFQRVLELKPGDGPSGFYGALLKKLGNAALPEGWLGEIDLT